MWHNGQTGGSFAFLVLSPEHGIALVLLTNTSRRLDDVASKLFGMLVKLRRD